MSETMCVATLEENKIYQGKNACFKMCITIFYCICNIKISIT